MSGRPQNAGAAHEQELLEGLRALYRDVDALFSGASCDVSSECCRFGVTGREPQVTSLELVLVQRAVAARGGAPRASKRALPLTSDAARERVCPLLDRERRCSVYQARPLGCRSYFCQRARVEPPSRAALRDVVQRLQALAAQHVPGGDRPRALARALAQGGTRSCV